MDIDLDHPAYGSDDDFPHDGSTDDPVRISVRLPNATFVLLSDISVTRGDRPAVLARQLIAESLDRLRFDAWTQAAAASTAAEMIERYERLSGLGDPATVEARSTMRDAADRLVEISRQALEQTSG